MAAGLAPRRGPTDDGGHFLLAQVETKESALGASQQDSAAQAARLRQIEAALMEADSTRRALHNTIQELKGNIRVFCRVRPGAASAPVSMDLAESNKLALSLPRTGVGKEGSDLHSFGFDKVFSPEATQEDLFTEVRRRRALSRVVRVRASARVFFCLFVCA
jgi:hypothetical protein